MSRKRKSYTPEFKIKLLLELLEEEKISKLEKAHSQLAKKVGTLTEDIYPKSYNTIKEARKGIGEYIQIYNTQRLHSADLLPKN